MFNQIKLVAIIAVVGFVGYSFFADSGGEQTADLGQVLDRTEYALNEYQGYLTDNKVEAAGDSELSEFTAFYTSVLNADPRFYDQPLGLSVQQDASFLGFADSNGNGTQDDGEGKVFTVEIDEENNRLIATDEAGNSSGLRFSGAGFLAGALLGTLLNRQRGAGVQKGAFNNRNVTPRSAYKAPSSARSGARSGGLRAGK
ncbi:hypothetical protein [Actibacterium sp. 188UL27-1]|uniref:hypothetical protein n=1 Tax=Actibacterium sp. 188UL27-1 TaxID=2786961 RepID=UPI0019560789|nr:hypothetical protein [Actibacterium sp. 188UL27-1]MBM7067402.1 hypothetical protein [Actibacterium sp. 188UL27-1]